MLYFPGVDQVLYRTCNVLDRNARIDAMLIKEIDAIGPESLERSLGNLLDVLGPAIQSNLLAVLDLETKLRCDDDLIAEWSQRFTYKLFISERPVHFSRVKERHTAFDG